MKIAVACVLLSVGLSASSTSEWVTLIPTVEKSIVRLEVQKGQEAGICTAVIFEIQDGTAYVLSAAHCVAAQPNERIDITISGRTAHVVDSNTILDLAILRYRARSHELAIPLAAKLPYKGEEAMIAGYAFAWEGIHEQFGHVSNPKTKEYNATALDITIIFGDSGGAAVNGAGQLIGVNSGFVAKSAARMGFVVSVEELQDYIDSFHDRMKKEKKP